MNGIIGNCLPLPSAAVSSSCAEKSGLEESCFLWTFDFFLPIVLVKCVS